MGAAALAIAASHRAVATAPRGCLVSYSQPVPENSSKNQRVADESVDLSAMAHELEPALSGLRELLAPLAQAIERETDKVGYRSHTARAGDRARTDKVEYRSHTARAGDRARTDKVEYRSHTARAGDRARTGKVG